MARPNVGDKETPWTIGEQSRGRVAVVDDHAVFRRALAVTLEHRGGFDVCVEAGSPAEARRTLGALDDRPDLVILGLHARGREMEDLARELCEEPSGAAVIGLKPDRSLGAVPDVPGKVRVIGADVSVDELLSAARQLVG